MIDLDGDIVLETYSAKFSLEGEEEVKKADDCDEAMFSDSEDVFW
jgi:hypothetical protein